MSAEGRALAVEVLRFLMGVRGDLPEGIETCDGRADLRAIVLPEPRTVGRVAAGGVTAEMMSGLLQFREVRWQGWTWVMRACPVCASSTRPSLTVASTGRSVLIGVFGAARL